MPVAVDSPTVRPLTFVQHGSFCQFDVLLFLTVKIGVCSSKTIDIEDDCLCLKLVVSLVM